MYQSSSSHFGGSGRLARICASPRGGAPQQQREEMKDADEEMELLIEGRSWNERYKKFGMNSV